MPKISGIILNLRFPTRLLCCVENEYKVVLCPETVKCISVAGVTISVGYSYTIAVFGPKYQVKGAAWNKLEV